MKKSLNRKNKLKRKFNKLLLLRLIKSAWIELNTKMKIFKDQKWREKELRT